MKIVYFDLDTVRHDHLHCYGYGRETSPVIDEIARGGTLFANHFCSNAPCVPSRGATFTGKFGIKTGIVTHGPSVQRIEEDTSQLQYLMTASGIPCTAISTFSGQADWFHKGWETYIRPCYEKGLQKVIAPDINRHAIPWLKQHYAEDFLLYIHYWDPHTPYNMPRDYGERFYDCKPLDFPDADTIERDQAIEAPFSAARRSIRTPEDFQRWISRYDGEIYYADKHVGEIVQEMEELGIIDETMIIVTSDHGEQQGQGGVYGDHVSAYEGVVHIPLVIRHPDHLPAGGVVDHFTYGLDVAPTILDLAGIEKPPGWDGESLLPAADGTASTKRSFVVCEHGLWTAQRVLREARWKLVKTIHPGFWDYGATELYDLEKDPNETTDLSGQEEETVEDLEYRLYKWVESMTRGRSDPLQAMAKEGPHAYQKRRDSLQRTGPALGQRSGSGPTVGAWRLRV